MPDSLARYPYQCSVEPRPISVWVSVVTMVTPVAMSCRQDHRRRDAVLLFLVRECVCSVCVHVVCVVCVHVCVHVVCIVCACGVWCVHMVWCV